MASGAQIRVTERVCWSKSVVKSRNDDWLVSSAKAGCTNSVVNEVQSKAKSPMEVTESRMVMLVNELHP